MNTGYLQAIVARRCTPNNHQPLDVDGTLCSISGKKQAALILEGHDNPAPEIYETLGTFKEGDILGEVWTQKSALDSCPIIIEGMIKLSPTKLELLPNSPTATITLESSQEWILIENPSSLKINKHKGPAGKNLITIAPIGIEARERLEFKNTVSGHVALLIVNVSEMF